MRYAFLLLFLFCPAIGGGNAQLLKSAILSIGTILFFSWHRPWRDDGFTMKHGLAVLSLALLATFLSPAVPWFEGFIGTSDRVEGLLMLAIVFIFGWFCFWNPPREFDEDGYSRIVGKLYIHLAWTLCLFVAGIFILKKLGGWDLVGNYVGTTLGIGQYLAICFPFILAWGMRDKVEKWEKIVAVILLALSVFAAGRIGVRCGIVAIVISSIIVILMNYNPKRILIVGCVVCALSLSVLSTPYGRARFSSIDLTAIGDGPRSNLIRQAWAHGTFPWGWGINAERFLIDRNGQDGMQYGLYDRFHSWPVDIWATLGWIGLIIILSALFRIWLAAWFNRKYWYMCGLFGMLASMLICSMWNPPTIQMMLLGAIAASGIVMLPFNPELRAPSLNLNALAKALPLQFVAAGTSIIMVTMVVGDVINTHAKKQWSEHTELPHVLLGQQAMAEKMNPWVQKDRIRYYYVGHKLEIISEPEGGKALLMDLLKQEPRDRGLESLLWLGLGEREASKRALMAGQMERNLEPMTYLK